MGLLTKLDQLFDRLSTCPHCDHTSYIDTCPCTNRRCVCWGERDGKNTQFPR